MPHQTRTRKTVVGLIAATALTGLIGPATADAATPSTHASGAAKAAPSEMLTLTKAAYLNVTDHSNVAAVEASGTVAPYRADVPTGAEVCFVYTLTNTSEYEIVLDSLRDSDNRLGDNGLLGGNGIELSPGESWKAFDCTTLKYLVTSDFDD